MNIKTGTYTPQAGTMGASALLALSSSETGRMSNAELLEAMGQPPGYAGMTNIMDNCMFYKLVETEKVDAIRYWSITQLGRETASRMLSNQKRPSRARERLEATGVEGSPLQGLDVPPAFTAETDESHLASCDVGEDIECALTSAGRLIIDANGVKQALSKDQTDQLLMYVDRARGIVWEGGAA